MNETIDIMNLATRKRFAATFWKELARRRRENPTVTRREVFEDLESLYEQSFDEELWTFDTFRHSKEYKSR